MQPSPDAAAEPLLAGAVRQAMEAHGSGRFAEAEALYEDVLRRAPEHPDALHLLGVLHAQRGEHDRAAALIGRAVAAAPAEAMFRNNLGNVEIERGRFAEAEARYLQAIELDPGRLDALNNLGVLLGRKGDAAGAEKVLAKVVELAPDFADARLNLAQLLYRLGRLGDAVQVCTDALIVAPRSPALRRLLAAAYSMMGMNDRAIAVYEAWLAVEPDNPIPLHHWRACTGRDVPDRAPDAYVADVFDRFAASFDAKLADLGYRAPQLVAATLERLAGPPAKALDVLDAGCGTGLCAPLLAPHARRLVGVDLSEGMLRRAVQRRAYDELAQGELVAFLRLRPGAFDAVVSADTLCYFGELRDFADAAAASLRPGGWVVFSLEAEADDAPAPYRLHEHGRYSHRRDHARERLAAAGFEGIGIEAEVLRREAGQPVAGWIVAAQRAPAR